MARTLLATQVTTRAGITPSYSAATVDGFGVDNQYGNVIFHVKNANAAPCTVTIGTTKSVDGRTLPALTVSVPATTGDKIIGPFDPGLYNEILAAPVLEHGLRIDFSVQSSVTVAAIKLGSTTY